MIRHRGRGACSSGKGANQQDVWNAESGSLDKMGADSKMHSEQWKAEPHYKRFLIQPVLLREGGITSLPPVFRERDPLSKSQRMQWLHQGGGGKESHG